MRGRDALRKGLPERTTVARIGGEEFAIIWPATDDDALVALAYETVRGVSNLGLPHSGSSHGRVTVSVGVIAVDCSPGTLPTDLLVQADAAMYRAEQEGRNRYAFDRADTIAPLGHVRDAIQFSMDA